MMSDQNKQKFAINNEQQDGVQQSQITQSFKPKINLFVKVRVEVLAQIYVFIDIHSLLQTRLVNKTCSMQFHQIIPLYVRQLEFKISFYLTLENEVKAKVEQLHNIEEIKLQSQKIYYQAHSITLEGLSEISSISRPAPYMVPEVLFYFCTLFDHTFNCKKESFRDDVCLVARKIMLNRHECFKQLLNYDISLISPQQLIILQQIHQLNPEDVRRIEHTSRAIFSLYLLIKMITEFRELPFYVNKNQERNIHQKIIKIKNEIEILQKVSKKSEQ